MYLRVAQGCGRCARLHASEGVDGQVSLVPVLHARSAPTSGVIWTQSGGWGWAGVFLWLSVKSGYGAGLALTHKDNICTFLWK